mgnify:CR=1 FL=1
MKILVTGGAGYIGSHTCVELLQSGHEVVVIDNLNSGAKENLPKGTKFYNLDILDKEKIDEVFKKEEGESMMAQAQAERAEAHSERTFAPVAEEKELQPA